MIDLSLLAAKFAFLAFLYIFLFWAVTVVLRDNAFAGQTRGMEPSSTARIINSPSGPSSYPIADSVLIGRAVDCDIRLDDDAASARHARLARRGRLWTIEDLESSNGTFVDGQRVSGRQKLKPGARIRIGRTELIIEDGRER